MFGKNIGFFNFTLTFKIIEMPCSKQFSASKRSGLDLYKVLSFVKLQISVFELT